MTAMLMNEIFAGIGIRRLWLKTKWNFKLDARRAIKQLLKPA